MTQVKNDPNISGGNSDADKAGSIARRTLQPDYVTGLKIPKADAKASTPKNDTYGKKRIG